MKEINEFEVDNGNYEMHSTKVITVNRLLFVALNFLY